VNNAELIVATLRAAGVSHGFGIPSGNVLPLLEAMRLGALPYKPRAPLSERPAGPLDTRCLAGPGRLSTRFPSGSTGRVRLMRSV
jgi:hypothetical protein